MTDRNAGKQASIRPCRRIAANLVFLALAFVLAASLSACGKKPGSIDPPPNVEDDRFPLTYPDTSTDPKP